MSSQAFSEYVFSLCFLVLLYPWLLLNVLISLEVSPLLLLSSLAVLLYFSIGIISLQVSTGLQSPCIFLEPWPLPPWLPLASNLSCAAFSHLWSKLGDTKTYPSGFPRQGRTLQILSAPLSGLWKGPGDQATAFPKCAAWCWGESGTRWMKMLKNFLPFLMWLFLDWEFIWLLWCLTDFHSSYKVILAILRCLFNVLLGEQEPGTC